MTRETALLVMKHAKLLLLLIYPIIFHFLYSENSPPAQNHPDAQTISDAVDFLVAAIGTQNPDPVMSTVLSAAPDTIRSVITFNANTNMQTLTLAIQDNPDKEQELLETRNKYQAILSAISGDPTQWKAICKAAQAKQKQRQNQAQSQESPAQEEKDSLDIQLGLFEKRVTALESERKSFPDFSKWGSKISDLNRKANHVCAEIGQVYFRIEQFLKAVAIYGEELREIESEMQREETYCKTLETTVVQAIQAALIRADNCKTQEDKNFVKSRYTDAQIAFNTLTAKLERVNDLLVGAAEKIDQINASVQETEKFFKESNLKVLKYKFYRTFNAFDTELINWKRKLGGVSLFNEKTLKLKSEISEAKSYYQDLFPNTSLQFDALIHRLDRLLIEPSSATEMKARFEQYSQELKKTRSEYLKDKSPFRWDLLPSEAPKLESLKKIQEEVEALHVLSALKIDGNKALADGCECEDDSASPADDVDEDNRSSHSSSTTDSAEMDNTTTTAEPSDGIHITGPSTITAGKWVEFKAVNDSGALYTDPSVLQWTKTRDDLLVIRNGQNPTLASGFKAGTAFIIVIHSGLQQSAMHAVKIRAEVPNLIGLQGEKALQRLRELNLVPVANELNPDGLSLENLSVKSLTPAPGTPLEKGAEVIVTLQLKADAPIEDESGDIADEDLFGTDGGEQFEIEEDDIADEDLFGTNGGKQVEIENDDAPATSTENEYDPSWDEDNEWVSISELEAETDDCEIWHTRVGNALQSRNSNEAIKYAQMAAVYGCDLDFGAVTAIVQEIEQERKQQTEDQWYEQETERMNREHEAWMAQHEQEQRRFREQLERDRQRWAEEDRQWQQTQDRVQNMIAYWNQLYQNQRQNNRSNFRDDGSNGSNSGWGSNNTSSSNTSNTSGNHKPYEVSYWSNGNVKEKRYYNSNGKLEKKLTYEENTGFFKSERRYHSNGKTAYLMTHWTNGRDDMGIASETFYDENGKMIKKTGYNTDGSVRESWPR